MILSKKFYEKVSKTVSKLNLKIKKCLNLGTIVQNGGADEDRTRYLLSANQMLSQMSYSPVIGTEMNSWVDYHGRENRIRTCDPLIPNQMHYQAVLFPEMAR